MYEFVQVVHIYQVHEHVGLVSFERSLASCLGNLVEGGPGERRHARCGVFVEVQLYVVVYWVCYWAVGISYISTVLLRTEPLIGSFMVVVNPPFVVVAGGS